ncbi:sugar ABC transporter substrate-binding protein [Actinopolymorpha sp. B17G11]|uniref:ABC transporter substrate-binding protein n=2 Tax=unclassified Actinopolymorpha TaxID=2627063 RepID=UPI0032E3CA2E
MDQRTIVQTLQGLDTTGMSRRRVLNLAAMAALAAPLAACAGDERTRRTAPTTDPAGSTAPVDTDRPENDTYPYDEAKTLFESLDWPTTNIPDPQSKVTVTMAITSDENAEVRHAQFAKFFRELHPNIEIKREITPWDDFLTKYMTQAAGGSLPDLMYSHYSWGQNLIKNNIIAPLDDFIAATPDFNTDDFTATARSYWEKDGKLHGVPTDSAPKMLWYNKEMFDKAGVEYPDESWTWQKVQEAAIELTSGKGIKKIFGMVQMPVPYPDLTPIYLLPFGARFLSQDETEVMIDSDTARDALKPWVDLQVKHAAIPSIAEMQARENADPYRANQAAMAINGTWILNDLLNLPPETEFDWGMSHMPSGPEGRSAPGVGSAFGLTTKAANPEAAWIVLNAFLSSAGAQYFRFSPPARLSAIDANLTAMKVPDQVITDTKAALQDYATSDGVLKMPATQKVVDTATPIWDRVRTGKLSLDDALKQIKERVTPVAKENV